MHFVLFSSIFLIFLINYLNAFYITWTSIIKLENIHKRVRLHSHEVNYGSGSGQQSVTGNVNQDDVNSHWQILAANNQDCKRGEPIKCGSIIRLKHLQTSCFLHSHTFKAPISSHFQEISCFGGLAGKDKKNKDINEKLESDSGDHFTVICDDEYWSDDSEVKFKHVITKVFLAVSDEQFNRPIAGQAEIVGISESNSPKSLWKTAEGVYIKPRESDKHSEL